MPRFVLVERSMSSCPLAASVAGAARLAGPGVALSVGAVLAGAASPGAAAESPAAGGPSRSRGSAVGVVPFGKPGVCGAKVRRVHVEQSQVSGSVVKLAHARHEWLSQFSQSSTGFWSVLQCRQSAASLFFSVAVTFFWLLRAICRVRKVDACSFGRLQKRTK